MDFAETTETENGNGNTESTADLISDAAIAHIFFESVSAPVLSGTQLLRFPDQGRLFGGSFGLLTSSFLSMSGDQDCITGEDEDLLPISKQRKCVVKIVTVHTNTCELAYIAQYSRART